MFFVPVYIAIYIKSINPILKTGLENKEEAARFYKKGNEQLELYMSLIRLNKNRSKIHTKQ